MKKVISLLALILFVQVNLLYAQPAPAANPVETSTDQVVLTNNETVSGPVTDNIRKKGEVVVLVNGKKTKFKAGDISAVRLGTTQYISSNYTFYEVIFAGKNITLLRKASEPSGVQFNGSEAAVVSSEGDIDDLFVKKANSSLRLLTKKNIKEVLGENCTTGIDAGKLDQEGFKKLVENCDSLK